MRRYKKHGKRNTRLYTIWDNMKRRCGSKDATGYENYGGRGISVDDEWRNDFESFYNWAMDNGYNESLTIDRINNEKNYTPDNCRWATITEQSRNKRKRIDNNSGHAGVSQYKATGRWAAYIWVDKKKIHLGYFGNIEDAIEARNLAKEKYWA